MERQYVVSYRDIYTEEKKTMFVCQGCSNGKIDPIWWVIGAISRGPCEICKKVSDCIDAPLSQIKDKENDQAVKHAQ